MRITIKQTLNTMINFDKSEMIITLQDHNIRVLVPHDIMSGKEFRRKRRKDNAKKKHF